MIRKTSLIILLSLLALFGQALLSPVKAAISNPTGWEWSSPATCSGAPPRGSADGMFEYAFAIAVDSQGYVYVADQGNRRVQKFN